MPPVRILIVKTSSMGDVIHALPLASDLAAALPRVQYRLAGRGKFRGDPGDEPARRPRAASGTAALAQDVAYAHGLARTHGRAACVEAAGYDWVLDVQGLLKSAWMARWAAAPVAGPASGSARERWAALWYTRPVNVPRELHAVERCRRIGAAVFGYDIDTPPRFDLSPPAATRRDVSSPFAVLLVNASRATKLWPEERWLELERWLATRAITSLLFWGLPTERARARFAPAMQRARVMPRAPLDAIAATAEWRRHRDRARYRTDASGSRAGSTDDRHLLRLRPELGRAGGRGAGRQCRWCREVIGRRARASPRPRRSGGGS